MKMYKFTVVLLSSLLVAMVVLYKINWYTYTLAIDKPNLLFALIIPLFLLLGLSSIIYILKEVKDSSTFDGIRLSFNFVSIISTILLLVFFNTVWLTFGSSFADFVFYAVFAVNTISIGANMIKEKRV